MHFEDRIARLQLSLGVFHISFPDYTRHWKKPKMTITNLEVDYCVEHVLSITTIIQLRIIVIVLVKSIFWSQINCVLVLKVISLTVLISVHIVIYAFKVNLKQVEPVSSPI